MTTVDLNAFDREVGCTYRGEDYLARDNGAVLRRFRKGGRRRPLDDKWTFGNPCAHSGYMKLSQDVVHRVVATAFHGPQPTASHVVDHVDTNRRNNRPENLRWVTRLENLLLNPITLKRVEYHYGSVEDFLANPAQPVRGTLAKDFEWMRTVTKAEAEYTRTRMREWVESDPPPGRSRPDDRGRGADSALTEEGPESLVESKTPGAVQRSWRTPAKFPHSLQVDQGGTVEGYALGLREGAVFSRTPFGSTTVLDFALHSDGAELLVLGESEGGAVKPWSLARVTLEQGKFVHESLGTFFSQDGAEKRFTLLRGLPWDGGDSIDDYT